MQAYEPLYHWLVPRPGTPSWIIFAALGILAVSCLYCAWVDWQTKIIPNKVTYPLLGLFLLASPLLWQDWTTHIICGLVGGLFFFLLATVKIRGQYAMGMGDVKLYAVAGLALGLGILPCIIISTLIGSVVGIVAAARNGVSAQIAHGPHITAAIILMIGLGLQGAY